MWLGPNSLHEVFYGVLLKQAPNVRSRRAFIPDAVGARSNGIYGGSCREGANRPNCEAYGSGMTSQTVGFGVGRKPRSIFSLSAFAK